MKKILLIVVLAFCIFQMVVLATAIDVGNAAIDRPGYTGSYVTVVDRINPANATGKITSVEIWMNTTGSDVEVATFYVVGGTGSTLSTRDNEYIGEVVAGAKRTFTVDLDVEADDLIGIFGSTGKLEQTAAGYDGYFILSGDHIPCEEEEGFTASNNKTVSIYGTGATEEEEEEANAIFFGTNI